MLAARLAVLGAYVFRFHAPLMLFQIVGFEIDRADHVLARAGSSANGPGLQRRDDFAIFEIKRFHHLTDKSIGQHDRRISIFVRQFERENGEIGHLLH